MFEVLKADYLCFCYILTLTASIISTLSKEHYIILGTLQA